MTTIGLGRTMSAFAFAAIAATIALVSAQPARSGVAASSGGPHVVATIGLDRQPDALDLAVDRLTGMVYGTAYDPNTVTVIDGRTNKVVASVPVGSHPRNVAVDQQTNTIYTTNTGDNSISVIAG